MATIREQIEAIEKEIRETPYHKGTEHYIGKYRAKLSKLRAQEIQKAEIAKGGGGGGYAVKKQGDATVVLVGPPSVGKSTLISKLTNAKSKVAPYAFTTLTVIPGMMYYNNANIQILDVPGIIGGAEKGRGRGREVLSVARGADLIVLITEPDELAQLPKIKESLYGNGIRLDIDPPKVTIEKRLRGNIVVHTNIKQDLDKETIEGVAREFGYKNAQVSLKEKVSMDRLIDAFATNRVYVKSIIVINKSDQLKKNSLKRSNELIHWSKPILISAKTGKGLNKFRENIWKNLNLLRVYLVKREEKPSFDNPIVMNGSITLGGVADKIGSEFAEGKKMAKIWGRGAKFAGQVVPMTTKAVDGMQVRFI